MKLIIITGLLGTGKTTLAKKISKKFKYPLVYKDAFKEILFDTLGYNNRELINKFGIASLK